MCFKCVEPAGKSADSFLLNIMNRLFLLFLHIAPLRSRSSVRLILIIRTISLQLPSVLVGFCLLCSLKINLALKTVCFYKRSNVPIIINLLFNRIFIFNIYISHKFSGFIFSRGQRLGFVHS